MSKFMCAKLAGLALAVGLTISGSAQAYRTTDDVRNTRIVYTHTFRSESEADADFDWGHSKGYVCSWYEYKNGTYMVTWNTR
jgi:hypothetical protein